MVRKAVVAGTFDPITKGHIDIIERATKMFDEVVVVIGTNSNKNCLFTLEERVEMIKDACRFFLDVKVDTNDHLLMNYCMENEVSAVVRGIRSMTDFEYENQIAQVNRVINSEVETIFILSDTKYSFVSSSVVKEMSRHSYPPKEFVTPLVAKKLREKFNR